ncbi:pumilio homolog 3 isoform X2 [Anabrus simplex]|uniref:pumilio homolog 3 isoform X2 n=1 Tax=Anabrus simplex TaxID=316456 RepID=UPI0035A2CCD9
MGSSKRFVDYGGNEVQPKKKKVQKDQKDGSKNSVNYQKKLEAKKRSPEKKKKVRIATESPDKTDGLEQNNKKKKPFVNNIQKVKSSSGSVDRKPESKKKFIGKQKQKAFQGKGKDKKGIAEILKDLKEKPDWKDLKKKAKEMTKKRKEQKHSQYDITVKAKKLWEQVRRDDCPPEKAIQLTTELYGLLKNQLVKMVYVHDMARIVQWLLKLGAPVIRDAITEELKPILGNMVQGKYASFCVKRMLKYGSPESRNTVMKSFQGSVVKYMSHAIASPVVEYAYDHWATVTQRNELKQEFYGDAYKLAVSESNQDGNLTLTSILSKSPEMKKLILEDTKKNILHIINKGLFKSTLVLSVVLEFLNNSTSKDRDEILTSIHPYVLDLLHIREGARVGMMCCWYLTTKDRKKIMKNLKGHVKNVALSEHGHLFLLALFDSVDDTVALKKMVLAELLADASEIAANVHGRKVILYLVAHRDPLYFHPSLMNIIVAGDSSETIKKDMNIRESELRDAVISPLLESVACDPSKWFSSGSIAMVTLGILKAGKGEQLEKAFEAIARHICSSKSRIVENDVSYPIMEHSGIHMVLKKLIQHDKEVVKNGDVSFSSVLVQELSESSILRGITCNRFCFLLTANYGAAE